MSPALTIHPDSECWPVAEFSAAIEPAFSDEIRIEYLLRGTLSDLVFPPLTEIRRGDELWKSTCFELFIMPAGDAGYYEFNFTPRGDWAAYSFGDYRSGMQSLDALPPPRINIQRENSVCYIMVGINIVPLVKALRNKKCHVGLSAVIEESGGNISYWALAHPQGKPDFHHRDCFALQIEASDRA